MRSHSLLGQIIFSAGSGVLVFVGLWTAAAVLWLYSGAVLGLEREADSQAQELSMALAPVVWNLDEQAIQGILDTKAQNTEFIRLVVSDPKEERHWLPRSFPRAATAAPSTLRKATISYAHQEIGTLTLELTLGPRQQQVAETVFTLVASLLLLFLAILTSITLSWRNVATRLGAMVQTMEEFSVGGGVARMHPGEDELGILAKGFNSMADRIQATTRSMENEIQDRTDRLMESEKLALIGSLVAGVAHEINTPIGNGITVTSWLATRAKEIHAAHDDASLSAEALGIFLADVESTLQILQSGLDRTSNLIQSFKKIGADQVVDERRPIDVEAFLHEVVASLSPTLKRVPHKVVLDCPETFIIENHSGALFQIVTNLILNAHHHAFAADQPGIITLSIRGNIEDGRAFQLGVRDDGIGMEPEVKARIFEPFFTTKRVEGGTGLGLSIVHNLVQNLGGVISVHSAPGQGSEFLVTLPRTAPDRPPVAN